LTHKGETCADHCLVVEAGLIYLDKPANGSVAAYEDGFTLLELTRKYYREAGLDARELDLLIR
jgi:2,4'-dihydroxyacetophenone dioxygenase